MTVSEAHTDQAEPTAGSEETSIDVAVVDALKLAIGKCLGDAGMFGFFSLAGVGLGILSLMATAGVSSWPRALLSGSILFLGTQYCYICGLQYMRPREERPNGLSHVLYAGFLRFFPWLFLLGIYAMGLCVAVLFAIGVPLLGFFAAIPLTFVGLYLLPTMVGFAVRRSDHPPDRNSPLQIVGDNRTKIFGLFALFSFVLIPLSVAAPLSDTGAILLFPLLGIVNGMSYATLGYVFLQGR